MMCLRINPNVHMAYNLSFIVKSEKVLKVTGCHVHFKSGISETVLDSDVTTDH